MQCEHVKDFARRIVGITRISEVVVDRLRQDVDLCLISNVNLKSVENAHWKNVKGSWPTQML